MSLPLRVFPLYESGLVGIAQDGDIVCIRRDEVMAVFADIMRACAQLAAANDPAPGGIPLPADTVTVGASDVPPSAGTGAGLHSVHVDRYPRLELARQATNGENGWDTR